MIRFIIIFLFILSSYFSIAQIQEIVGFEMPESIVMGRRYMYVSNVGKAPIPPAGTTDGYITKLDKNGKLLKQKFIDKLKAPKGMAVQGDNLLVADVDHLLGFDLATGKKTLDIGFEGQTNFLNDVAVKNDSIIFLSSTDTGLVYQVNTKRKTSTALDIEKIKGPNGLVYDKARNILYVNGFGEGDKPNGQLGKISFIKNKAAYTVLHEDKGHMDGLALIGNTLLYTDWIKMEKAGVLKKYNIHNNTFNTIFMKEKLGGPADFLYDFSTKRIIVPLMLENKIIIIKL